MFLIGSNSEAPPALYSYCTFYYNTASKLAQFAYVISVPMDVR